MKNVLIILSFSILFSILFSGCGYKFMCKDEPQKIEIKTIIEQKQKLDLPNPKPIVSKPVKWYIITPENYKHIFDKMNGEKLDLVLFGLTDDGYKNLSLNTLDIQKYLLEQQKIIKEYKKYYESNTSNTTN